MDKFDRKHHGQDSRIHRDEKEKRKSTFVVGMGKEAKYIMLLNYCMAEHGINDVIRFVFITSWNPAKLSDLCVERKIKTKIMYYLTKYSAPALDMTTMSFLNSQLEGSKWAARRPLITN